MVRMYQHVSSFQPKTKGMGGHIHLNYSADADIVQEGVVEGKVTFNGDTVAVQFDGHKGHYHIDFSAELQALRDSVMAGDYDAH